MHLLLGFFISLTTVSYSQFSVPPDLSNCVTQSNSTSSVNQIVTCDNTITNSSSDFVSKYKTLPFWKPASTTPIKTIQVAIHVFEGTNSLTNQTSDVNFLNNAINVINDNLTNNCSPTDPITGTTDITDSKIRFDLVAIYFYPPGNGYTNSSNTSGMISYINSIDPARLNYLSILVPVSGATQHATPPFPGYIPQALPSLNSLTANQFAYVPLDNTLNSAWIAVLAHELGHCMDLLHITAVQNDLVKAI